MPEKPSMHLDSKRLEIEFTVNFICGPTPMLFLHPDGMQKGKRAIAGAAPTTRETDSHP